LQEPHVIAFDPNNPYNHFGGLFEIHSVPKVNVNGQALDVVQLVGNTCIGDIIYGESGSSKVMKALYLDPNHLVVQWKMAPSDTLSEENYHTTMEQGAQKMGYECYEKLKDAHKLARSTLLNKSEVENWQWIVIVFPNDMHLLNEGFSNTAPQREIWNGREASVVDSRQWYSYTRTHDKHGRVIMRCYTTITFLLSLKKEKDEFYILPESQNVYDRMCADLEKSMEGMMGK
jgi:hypothetical protein